MPLLLSFALLPLQGWTQSTSVSRPDHSASIEEIIVTAQRREQRLQDVPISASVLTAGDLELSRVNALRDVVRQIPNMGGTPVPDCGCGGPRGPDRVSIRGIQNLPGAAAPAFSWYVDEFNMRTTNAAGALQGPRGVDFNLLDLERVEVLRGPQGTLFGKNSIGGALSAVTIKPSEDFYSEITGDWGRDDTWLIRGAVNGALVDDKLTAKAVAYRQSSDGFIRDIGPAGNDSTSDLEGYRVAFRLTPAADWVLDLTYSDWDHERRGEEAVPDGAYGPGGVALDDGQGFWPENKRLSATNSRVGTYEDTTLVTLRAEREGPRLTLTSLSGYMDTETGSSPDRDMSLLDVISSNAVLRADSWSQEFRLQPTQPAADTRLQYWLLGAMYSEDSGDYTLLTDVGTDTPWAGFSPNFLVVAMHDYRSFSVFGETVWRISARLEGILGGRFSYDALDYRLDVPVANPPFTPPGFSLTYTGDKTFNDFSPRLGLSFRWREDVSTYITATRGYRTGGFRSDVFTTQKANPVYDPEHLWSYEAGFKATFRERRMRLNAALFYIDWHDMQIPVFDTGISNVVIRNAAEATSRGFELELTSRPFTNLQLGFSAGYTDAEYENYPNCEGPGSNCAGDPIPLTPEWTLSAAAQYDFRPGQGVDAYFRLEAFYQAETTIDQERLFSESYANGNLRLGATVGRWQVTAYVENLIQPDYYIGSICPNSSANGCQVVPERQQYGLRFTFSTR